MPSLVDPPPCSKRRPALNTAGAANAYYVLSDRGTWIHFKNKGDARYQRGLRASLDAGPSAYPGRSRQSLPILDLSLPLPPPGGAEWLEAYRRWHAEG